MDPLVVLRAWLVLSIALAPGAFATGVASAQALEVEVEVSTQAPESGEPAEGAPSADSREADEADEAREDTTPARRTPSARAAESALEGERALSAGRLEDAREAFSQAFHLDPRPERLWALSRALEALRDDSALLDAYRGYLAAAPEGPRAEEIRARVAVLRARPAAAASPGPEGEPVAETPPPPAPENEDGWQGWDPEDPVMWVVIGIIAAAVAGALIASSIDSGSQEPRPGDDGLVVHTLLEWP